MNLTTRVLGVVGLAASLLVGAACTPDETGYGDETGLNDDLGDPALEDAPEGDDADGGTGGGRGASVYYAPSDVLGSLPIDVTVIAPAGTFGSDDLSVAAEGEDADPLRIVDGGFVATVVASAGDEVTVAEDGAVVSTLTLEAGAGSAAPGATDSDTSDGLDEPSFDASTGGGIPVGDGTFGLAAPYLAYNVDRGASVFVDEGETDVTLSATSGDRVCLAPVSPGAADLGAPWCAEVP